MPFAKCPVCGELFHINVGDVKKWYADHYPNIPVGELVPGKCRLCWQDLEPGDRIIVRAETSLNQLSDAGSCGSIIRIVSACEHGSLYLCRMDSGKEKHFIRAELRKAPVS